MVTGAVEEINTNNQEEEGVVLSVRKNVLLLFFIILFCTLSTVIHAKGVDDLLSEGKVTMVDIGAKECVPCQLMKPILHELKKEYDNRVGIVVVDAYKKPDMALELGITSVPTQIFYDSSGQEVERHIGYMDREEIVAVFDSLGVK
jgi:thioredoxin 1